MKTQELEKRLNRLGVGIPEILLPVKNIDLENWAVIACDQFSSEPEYWARCRARVGDDPSTLHLIYPEAYYESEPDRGPRINAIHASMNRYLTDGTLNPAGKGFVYLERSTSHVPLRRGLLVLLDLEEYDFKPGSKPGIRPTEGTIVERIPPRMKIRDQATLDLTHILVLINDPEDHLFSGLSQRVQSENPLYRTNLMEGGGSLTGWMLSDEETITHITESLERVAAENPFPFAVGDGNHSLATAREVWEKRKKEGAGMDHPARYALVEIENIHDAGMVFEPIHRVLFHVDFESFSRFFTSRGFRIGPVSGNRDYGAVLVKGSEDLWLTHDPVPGRLIVELIQDALDDYLKEQKGVMLDYIHGEESVRQLSCKENTLGLLLPVIDKGGFFRLIEEKGVLPRKAFSIGEAVEKRYYLEARKLRP